MRRLGVLPLMLILDRTPDAERPQDPTPIVAPHGRDNRPADPEPPRLEAPKYADLKERRRKNRRGKKGRRRMMTHLDDCPARDSGVALVPSQ